MNVEPVGMVELVERMTCGAFLPLNARGAVIAGSHNCLAGILVLSRRGSGWVLTLGSGELVRLTLEESSLVGHGSSPSDPAARGRVD